MPLVALPPPPPWCESPSAALPPLPAVAPASAALPLSAFSIEAAISEADGDMRRARDAWFEVCSSAVRASLAPASNLANARDY